MFDAFLVFGSSTVSFMICSLLFCWYGVVRKESAVQKLLAGGAVKAMFKQWLVERLDRVVLKMKAQIPMVTMFLSASKEDQLKEEAFEELSQLIPIVEARLLPTVKIAVWKEKKFIILALWLGGSVLFGAVNTLSYQIVRSFFMGS